MSRASQPFGNVLRRFPVGFRQRVQDPRAGIFDDVAPAYREW